MSELQRRVDLHSLNVLPYCIFDLNTKANYLQRVACSHPGMIHIVNTHHICKDMYSSTATAQWFLFLLLAGTQVPFQKVQLGKLPRRRREWMFNVMCISLRCYFITRGCLLPFCWGILVLYIAT